MEDIDSVALERMVDMRWTGVDISFMCVQKALDFNWTPDGRQSPNVHHLVHDSELFGQHAQGPAV